MTDSMHYSLSEHNRKTFCYQLIIHDILQWILYLKTLSELFQSTLFGYLIPFNNRTLSDNDKTNVDNNQIRTQSNKPSSSTTQNNEQTVTISTTTVNRSSPQTRFDEVVLVQHTQDTKAHNKKGLHPFFYKGNNSTVSLVWLISDMEMNQIGNRIQDKLGERFIFFDDKYKCLEYIQSKSDTTIFLVTCDKYAQDLILIVHDLSQIYSLYIHCDNIDIQSLKLWSESYPKVWGVFSIEESLLYKLALDLALYYIKQGDEYNRSETSYPSVKDGRVKINFKSKAQNTTTFVA
ncbi:unnamed protein product [Didymodactylos carnosus]|uniref:Uncharacterized protein n=1 Tax=Didymodactylos carnosus TaxID=1234261 RepID=A0A814Q7X5_9BILA|nr:unnamed protein product [Didymodactylos carnosus]CAF3879756.1 unnamed protein product [Didymodactylos carnosus]